MTTFWFITITVLWTGFMILEGFDFGVGTLHGVVGRDDQTRREVLLTIGPVWDGNEVWLVVAAAAMFAAFPGWYATAFSGLYLAVVLLLVALILRGVAIEFRSKRDSARWRRLWSAAVIFGSVVAPFVVGVTLADFLYGLPIDASQEFVGNFGDLFSPYAIVMGFAFIAITLLHGAVFLAIKTHGPPHYRSQRLARMFAPITVALVLAAVIWTHVVAGGGALLTITELAAIVAVVAAAWLVAARSYGWAFVATTVTVAGVVLSIFTNLYPNVLVSTLGSANNLTVHNTSSAPYSLKVMTFVLAFLLPVVLVYQAWTYHVFRRRITSTT